MRPMYKYNNSVWEIMAFKKPQTLIGLVCFKFNLIFDLRYAD